MNRSVAVPPEHTGQKVLHHPLGWWMTGSGSWDGRGLGVAIVALWTLATVLLARRLRALTRPRA